MCLSLYRLYTNPYSFLNILSNPEGFHNFASILKITTEESESAKISPYLNLGYLVQAPRKIN